MAWLLIVVRRLLWVVLIAAAGGVAWSWWRDRNSLEPAGPAEWPPFPPRHDVDATAWISSDPDGGCPLTHPIKAKNNSRIFHVPEGRFYARTNADRCYQSADAAVADGYRQAKS